MNDSKGHCRSDYIRGLCFHDVLHRRYTWKCRSDCRNSIGRHKRRQI